MDYTDNELPSNDRIQELFHVLFILSLSMLGFLAIGPFIGLLLALPFTESSLIELQDVITDPFNSPDGKVLLYAMQVGATTGMFSLPLLYLNFRRKEDITQLTANSLLPLAIPAAILITISFMGINSLVVEWNANLSFPEFLSDFERWSRQLEEQGAKMTAFMTDFEGPGAFLLALFIMAILPAIGEELVFRGFIQNSLFKSFNNIHIAIWVSAAIFSTIHMQFFGFFPRMLLGGLFGYLYVFSGNIWVPIVAHFANNAFTLLMLYLYNSGNIEYDIQNSESPTLASLFIFSIITFGLIYYFRKLYSKQQNG